MHLISHGTLKNVTNNSNWMTTVSDAQPDKEVGSRQSWEANGFIKEASTISKSLSTRAN